MNSTVSKREALDLTGQIAYRETRCDKLGKYADLWVVNRHTLDGKKVINIPVILFYTLTSMVRQLQLVKVLRGGSSDKTFQARFREASVYFAKPS